MTILVAYASRSGSTASIAKVIGQTLTQQGISVDVLPMTEVEDITPYQAIVAGSAIRQENWLPEAMQFIEKHQSVLRQKPVATFLVCMALATSDAGRYDKALQSASNWMAPVRDLVQPMSEGLFAGVLDLTKITELHFRIALRLLVAIGLFPEGDHRDLDAIRQWADALPAQLLKHEVFVPSMPITIN